MLDFFSLENKRFRQPLERGLKTIAYPILPDPEHFDFWVNKDIYYAKYYGKGGGKWPAGPPHNVNKK